MTTTINNPITPLPWHDVLWKSLHGAAQRAKLPHAILLQGPPRSGKTQFIKSFAQLMLCAQPRMRFADNLCNSCGQCPGCLWYGANTHPNYYEITPNISGAGKAYILIDQIRSLTDSLQQTSGMSTKPNVFYYHTIVVIDPAEALHPSAANALLKTLEEPILGVLFILASAQPKDLPPTIRSRCQQYTLPKPSRAKSLAWIKSQLSKTSILADEKSLATSLYLANNMPLQALESLNTDEVKTYQSIFESLVSLGARMVLPSETAQNWSQYPTTKLLDYLMLATAELIQLKLGGVNVNSAYIDSVNSAMSQCMQRVSVEFLFHYWDKLQQTRSEMNLYTLNVLLSLEMLAYCFSSSSSFS